MSALQKNIFGQDVARRAASLFRELETMTEEARIEAINAIKADLHRYSPFAAEPVDCVVWVPAEDIQANDYNPNSVAPPEMKLLEKSILQDGYTQPIVAWRTNGHYEVVDGFHRNRVGRECLAVRKRVKGYLPLTIINEERQERGDRIAATIRHNRARGKHQVQAMSDIVVELKRRNWSEEKIGNELGMDPDEVLRLCQITGLVDVFSNQDFSKAWDIGTLDENADEDDIEADAISNADPQDDKRIFHTWEKWECYPAGFYDEKPKDGTVEQGEEQYRAFLSDLPAFEAALDGVITTWKNSCEHYLTNERMNRIAWLGQASLAYALHVPSCCRGGYNLLTDEQKRAADDLALKYLNKWLLARGEKELTADEAISKTEADLY